MLTPDTEAPGAVGEHAFPYAHKAMHICGWVRVRR